MAVLGYLDLFPISHWSLIILPWIFSFFFQITTTFPKDPVYTFSISQNPFPIENRDVLGETQVRGDS